MKFANETNQLVSKKGFSGMAGFGNAMKDEYGELTTRVKETNKAMQHFEGTTQKAKDALSSLVSISNGLNLSTKKGQDIAVDTYNNYYKIRDAISDATIDFEKLYRMQKEYAALTGKEFKVTSFSEMQGLSKRLEDEKELIRLIKQEEEAKKQADKEAKKQADAEINYLNKQNKEFQKREKAELESLRINQKRADVQKAIANQAAEEKFHAERLAKINQGREQQRIIGNPRTIEDFQKKIS